MYRLIIADDEMIECKGLERMIQSFFAGIELLPSVSNGVDLIQSVSENKPDIAIVDINMPGLNGLEAIEILRMKSIDTKIIINTAYNNFDYIKKALVLGASDYLLKPMEEQKFREALSRVCQMIEKERQTNKLMEASSQKLEKIRKVAEAEIMASIFLGNPNEEEFSILFENLNSDYFGGLMVAGVLENNGKNAFLLDVIREKIEKLLRSYCTCMTRTNKNVLYLFLIPGETVHADNYQKWVKELLGKVLEMEADSRCDFGISSWKYEFEKMSEAYYESQIAVKNASSDRIHFFEEAGEEKDSGNLERESGSLTVLAQEGYWEEFELKIKSIIEQYKEKKDGDKILWLWIFRLILQCKFMIDSDYFEGISESIFEKQVWKRIEGCYSEEELLQAVRHFLREEKKDTKNQDIRSQYVQEALLYMEKNYRKDLSLEHVAEIVGISSFYLSRLLKHQMEKSFVELLTDIRVAHAIRLIMKEDSTAKDIGSQVGYPSRSYFYKVFKKNTGMTVGEMRELFRK